jgi:hypothetical protein
MHERTFVKVFMGGLLCCALAACSSDSNDSDSDAPSGQGGATPSGGGSLGSNTGGMPELPGGGGGDDDERFDSCQDCGIPPLTGVPRPTGSAQVSMTATGTAAAVDVELIEVVCEAVHDRGGQVAGFRASFFETWDRPGSTSAYASVTWEGAFAGNGTYEEASFSYSADASFGSRDTEFRSGTPTLSEGGRVGTFSANAGDATLLSTAAAPTSSRRLPSHLQPPRCRPALCASGAKTSPSTSSRTSSVASFRAAKRSTPSASTVRSIPHTSARHTRRPGHRQPRH